MTLHLVDLDDRVVRALRDAFASERDVTVATGNILELAEHVLVSPANGSGFMDGGADRHYARLFGSELTRRVRDRILQRPEGHLPIGASLAVETGHARIPWLVVAPTMISPEHVPPTNAYRALRAALRLAADDARLHGDWYCPGLATGVGAADPDEAAREMAEAWRDWRASFLAQSWA